MTPFKKTKLIFVFFLNSFTCQETVIITLFNTLNPRTFTSNIFAYSLKRNYLTWTRFVEHSVDLIRKMLVTNSILVTTHMLTRWLPRREE